MAGDLILDNGYGKLIYHPEKKIVHHTFQQPIGGEHFREVVDKGVEVLKAHGAYKWLSDDRANSALSPEDTQWAMEDWMPRALQAGWKHWALVVPESLHGRINMSEILNNFRSQGLERAMVFTDPDDALQWLESI